jgi:hypothetical protein
MKNLSNVELFLLREWAKDQENSCSLENRHFIAVSELKKTVDKTLWAIYISNETPWGNVEPASQKFEDLDFEKTIESLKNEK